MKTIICKRQSMEALEGHFWVSTHNFILLNSYDFWFMTFDLWLLIYDFWFLTYGFCYCSTCLPHNFKGKYGRIWQQFRRGKFIYLSFLETYLKDKICGLICKNRMLFLYNIMKLKFSLFCLSNTFLS
jgi:hypothetical protein